MDEPKVLENMEMNLPMFASRVPVKMDPQLMMAVIAGLTVSTPQPQPLRYTMRPVLSDEEKAANTKREKKEKKARKLAAKMQRKNHK